MVAARAALSGQALGQPKARNGDVEAIRVLMVARRSAASERIAALNQLRHLCFTADHQVRGRFERLSVGQLTAQAAALRPRPSDTVRYSTLLAMRTLARRVAYLDDELDNLAVVIRPLVERTSPGLLAMHGVGYDVAAKLLIAAGDNPVRPRSTVPNSPLTRRRPPLGSPNELGGGAVALTATQRYSRPSRLAINVRATSAPTNQAPMTSLGRIVWVPRITATTRTVPPSR